MKTTDSMDYGQWILNNIRLRIYTLATSKNINAVQLLESLKLSKSYVLMLCLVVLFCFNTSSAQTNNATDTVKYVKNPKPSLKATRLAKPPKIDGQPTDECWKDLPIADDFIMYQPNPYKKSPFRSEVKIAYDDVAIYVLAYYYDPEPQQIRRELGARDEPFVNADIANIGFDTYDDDQNAFRFGVTAAGVQFDSRVSNGNNTDFSWDAVWESDVSIQKDGWVAEYKIPFSALRFSDKPIQTWGLQIARGIKRTAQEDSWASFDPKIDGLVIQYGALTDLQNIKPPLRLQFSPYIAAGVQRSPSLDNNGNLLKYGNQSQLTGGMDVKYGINQSFTLDMTLIPNFGQVQSDNQVLNLTPFEVQFNENRPFFTEGSEIFNKGDLFYSRRIGGTPDGYWGVRANDKEIVKNNPNETQLYNATKLSGRTKNNVAVGVLNAITAPMYATIENTESGITRQIQTAALTNYNLLAFSKAMKNNSEISFVNASTIRNGDGRDANVSALYTRLRDKKNNYELFGGGRLSQIFEKNEDAKRGFTTSLGIGKVSGALTWRVNQEITSNTWDPNDLGIFNGNNTISHFVNLFHQQVEPGKVFLATEKGINVSHNLQYSTGRYMDFGVQGFFWGKFKNQWWANMWHYAQPTWTYDFFEPRVDGKEFKRAPIYVTGTNFGTDRRKQLYWYSHFSVGKRTIAGHSRTRVIIEPRYRVNDKLSFSLFSHYVKEKNDIGFSTFANDEVLFGKRNIRTLESTFSTKLSFTAKSNLTFRARHYWSNVVFKEFYNLKDDGSVTHLDWQKNQDRNINFFNIDMIYTWQFAPGSFMNVIWKNSINKFENGMDYIQDEDYFKNVTKTFQSPQTNNFTLKVIYFLDYLDVKKRLK